MFGLIFGVLFVAILGLAVQFHPERMMLSFADGAMADGAKIIECFLK